MGLRFIFVFSQVLVFFVIITFGAQCDPQPTDLKICSVSHKIPYVYSQDNYGDSVVYNALTTNPSTTKNCAQAYADYECSVLYPTCDPTTNPGTTPACRNLCSSFISACSGQLTGISRDNCTSLPTTQCTSNTGSELDLLYPPPPSHKLSGGAIAGIVIGVIVFVIIVIILVLVVRGTGACTREPSGRTRATSSDADVAERNHTKGKTPEARETGGAQLSVRANDSDPRKAKAPDSPSPRLSMTIGQNYSGGATAVAGTAAAGGSPASEKEAKIKEQLDALPEAHRKPPPPWNIYFTDEGDLYFWNSETDESSWEYPIKS